MEGAEGMQCVGECNAVSLMQCGDWAGSEAVSRTLKLGYTVQLYCCILSPLSWLVSASSKRRSSSVVHAVRIELTLFRIGA